MKGDVMEDDDFEVNEGNYLSVTPEEVASAVGSVTVSFDEKAARNLIRYFHYRLKNGALFNGVPLRQKERAFLDYVEHAFSRFVEQEKSLNVAFGLTSGTGNRPRDSTTERNVIAAAYMVLLIKYNHWKWEDAKGEVANFLFPDGEGEKAVEKAYSDRRDEFWLMKEETLRELLPNNTPQINARSA